MARSSRKAIFFDLDTSQMKAMSLYPGGYGLLKNTFKKNGFTYRQGSGYVSEKKLTESKMFTIIEEIVNEQPWLTRCVKAIDISDIGKKHDVTAFVKALGEKYAEKMIEIQKAREERRAARSIAEPKIAEAEQQPVVSGMAAALERLKAMCPMYQLEVASGGKESADAKFDKAFKSKAPKAHSSDRVQRSDKARSRKKQVVKGKSNGKA